MRPLEYRINLDFANESSNIFCNVRQGDNCSKIVAALREDGRAYDIEGDNLSVVFAALKSDGNTIYDDCTVENNTIIYDFNNQTAPVSGTVPCQFILIDSENGEAKRISTPVFFLEVSDNVDIDEENIVSSESYTALTNKIAQAQALINQIQHDLDTGAYKGDKGDKGDQGDPGADGFSPTATVTKSGHTATITITDKNGTTTAEISDGEGGDVSNKMDLAPLNPTAEQIAAMPNGQLYSDTVNRKGVLKGGQSFYDTVYVDNNYRKTIINSQFRPPCNTQNNQTDYKVGDTWITTTTNSVRLYKLAQTTYSGFNGYTHYWEAETPTCHYISRSASLPIQIVPKWVDYGNSRYFYEQPQYSMGDYICRRDSNMQTIALYICVSAKIQRSGTSCVVNYIWEEVSIPYNTYTKTEIDTMIGDIETALSEV